MSQIVTRKGPVGEDKEKGSSDTPVKEMKKKMAANAEKEKQAAEKHAEQEKEKDKPSEAKQLEKTEKSVDKNSEKKEKPEKSSDKNEKQAEKEKGEKSSEKKEKQAEKEKVDKSADKKSEAPVEKPKEDKNTKVEKPDEKDKDIKEKDKKRTPDTPKPKQNGARPNGVPATSQPAANGEHSDGTVSSDEELVIIDHERDDMFPELAYDDSDGEFEPPTPEGLPSRSYTRRSQAKAARTPETPRPASDKRAEKDADDSKESKILKLKDDTPSTDRKLRSSDSPKPETKKPEKKQGEKEVGKETNATKAADKASPKKKDLEVPEGKDEEGKDKSAMEIVIDVDIDESAVRKDGTNYSRSRVKVSPYRRAADQTTSSVAANYTGNNTTMEMDITEISSLTEETPSVDSPYLSGLRSIRGRRSYKPLKEMALRNISVNRSVRSTTSVTVTEQPSRPTAPVVGRKRKPEGDESIELATAAHEAAARSKRARLLEKLARPFRTAASTPLPVRRSAEIVGINTDLPLTAPVASPDTFDPETLKASTPATPPPVLVPEPERDRDNKLCSIM